jgi:SAM-dependent methyltransferase
VAHGPRDDRLIYMPPPERSKHLPYVIDPSKDREAYYETYWKKVSLDLLLKHVVPQGQTVLDYGCGRGETLGIFGAAGFQVTGTDVDPECVRLGGRFGPTRILEPDNPVGQFGEKSFDIVTCFHVLEHVDNPRKTLNDLRRLARQYVLLAVPNLRYLNLLFTRKIDLAYVNEGHLQSWDHWHLRSLAERHCGLELVDWGFDATRLPLISTFLVKVLGNRAAIALETGLFRATFPFHGISVIGLFRVRPEN